MKINNNTLINKFKKMPWEVWLKRGFPVMVVYLMMSNGTKKAFAKYGIKGEFPIALYDRNVWYETPEMFALAGKEAEKYLKKTDIFFLTKLCRNAYKNALRVIYGLEKKADEPPLEQYKKIISSLDPLNVSVWIAHAVEVYFNSRLRRRLADYMKFEDIDKFIGDIGYPRKKNAHNLMAEDIYRGMSANKLFFRYGWMKSRTEAGFGDGYSNAEMEDLKAEISRNHPIRHRYPPAPKSLNNMIKQLREVVYLRTLRSDALFECYFRAKPIFARVEREFGIDSVKNYIPNDLLDGNLNKYSNEYAVLKYYDDVVVTEEKVAVQEGSNKEENILKGAVAWKGKAVGKVRKIFNPKQASSLKTGEVLVTNMTIPAYLQAMKRASAFVTDEGGITCHAAILAREMKKPCIIGTKNATKILRDGDLVEVDADNGIVRKI